jgi:hypothetical protein
MKKYKCEKCGKTIESDFNIRAACCGFEMIEIGVDESSLKSRITQENSDSLRDNAEKIEPSNKTRKRKKTALPSRRHDSNENERKI